MDNVLTYPLARPAPSGAPLEPSAFWDETADVEWNLLPRSPFADAVRYLKLPYRLIGGGNLLVKTTAADLLLVIAYCYRRKETAVPRVEPVKRAEPALRAPWWDEGDDDHAD